MTLVDGTSVDITALRVAQVGLAAFSEDDEMYLMPFEEVRRMHVRRRPADVQPPKHPVGFEVTPV